jgi:hypothetical protein
MKSITDWVAFISLLLSYFSFIYMADDLYRKKIIKHRLFGFRPDIIFIEYYKTTKREAGHVGIWFWLTIYSFIIMILASLLSLVLTLFLEKTLGTLFLSVLCHVE